MNTSAARDQYKVSPVRRFLRHPLLAPFNSTEAWDRLASVANPAWSLSEPRARVVRVVDEAPGVTSLWLKPNGRFNGFRAGQHVLLDLDIDGARHARCFTLSCAPRADGLLRLTIKRKDKGPVSTAAQQLQPGEVVRLGQAMGDFSPRNTHAKLLMISAGSGVTPMVSLLQDLLQDGAEREVTLLHCGRTAADLIFADELQQLALRMPKLRLHLHITEAAGRLDAEKIAQIVLDWTERETLLCGPDGFMQMVETMYAAAGLGEHLQSESFGRRAAPVDPDAAQHAVSHGNPEQVFTALAGQSLLEAAESAGLKPKFGCRRGICRTCQCRKRSGTVTNLLTGQVSGPGEELIQLCISTPQSAVELAL